MEEALQAKPFAFRRRFERVDWRKLASVNLDQIARDLDFGALQENLTNIAFCNVELELDLRLIDPNFVKLFRMGQLTIEYLLYSQEYLSDTIISLEGRIKDQHKNEENLTEKLRMVERQLEKMKKEGHKRKKLIMDQQHLIEAGADNFHKCLVCPKAFMNSTFLQNHCVRRHGQTYQDMKESSNKDREMEIPPKISEQLEEIKERLIFTESQLAEERKSLKEMSVHESSLLAERDAHYQRKLEEWREESEIQHRKEVERIQNILMTELREMQEKQLATQKALEAAQQGIPGYGRPSNLGTSIRDDLDVERDLLQREREEVMRLKEQVKLQMDNMQEQIQMELSTHEERIRKETIANQKLGSHADVEKMQKELRSKQKEIDELKGNNGGHKGTQAKITNGHHPASAQSTNHSSQPMTNGHHGRTTDFVEKKKKTLTFADESDAVDSPQRLVEQVIVPDVRASPPTVQTLSSEEDSELDGEETTLVDGSSTNQSMSTTLGTLDLTGQSKELHEAITQNPKLLQDMKQQLQQVFNSELMRWDVQPDSEGMTSTKLATKQQHLAQERNKMEKKYKMFRETRLSLIKQVDDLAKAGANANGSLTAQVTHSSKDSRKLTGTMSFLTATMESSSWGTTSSKWSTADRKDQVPDISTDEESSSEDEPLPKYKPKTPSPSKDSPTHRPSLTATNQQSPTHSTRNVPERSTHSNLGSQSETSKPSSGWATVDDDIGDGGFTPSNKPPQRAIQMPGVDAAAESDWDEDDLSDLEEIGGGESTTMLRASTDSTIKTRAAMIESQLMGRKGKAPAGGINTLTLPSQERYDSASPTTPDIPKMEGSDDEDLIEAELAVQTATNTYSSRQWGQGSSANTLSVSGKPGGGSLMPSGEKASSVTSENVSLTSVTGTAQKGDSGSDWSVDSDFDL